MKRKNFSTIITLFFIVGCTFNVKEESKEITLVASSIGLTKISIEEDLIEDNDVDIQGIAPKNIIFTAQARMLVVKDDDDDLDKLQLTISQNGKIGLSYTGNNWSCIEIDEVSLDIDRSLDVDIKSKSGRIKVEDMESFLKLRTESGDCKIGTDAGCDLKTSSGDIEVTIMYDSLIDTTIWDVETESGEVEIYLPNDTLAFVNTVCKITVETESGDVTLKVPLGFTADLDYSTKSGDKDVTALFNDDPTSSNTIKCTTKSGDLTINSYW